MGCPSVVPQWDGAGDAWRGVIAAKTCAPQLCRVCCYLLIYLHPSKAAAEGWSRQREAKSSTEAPLSPSLLARGRTTLPCTRLLGRDPHNPAPVCAPPSPVALSSPCPPGSRAQRGSPCPPGGITPYLGPLCSIHSPFWAPWVLQPEMCHKPEPLPCHLPPLGIPARSHP